MHRHPGGRGGTAEEARAEAAEEEVEGQLALWVTWDF